MGKRKNEMNIAGLQKLTLLDYPDKMAACIFTPGCNLRCPFCHNAELVIGIPDAEGNPYFPSVALEEFFSFLDTRQGLLDGICITGGEPLLQQGIGEFCRMVHARGFSVKLDTNGTHPEKLQALIDEGLVDYVALDVKNSPARYGETVGLPDFDVTPIRRSIEILLQDKVDYEFRTTLVAELHDEEALLEIARWIRGARRWYLQNFVDSDRVFAGRGILHSYSEPELDALLPRLQAVVLNTSIRGETP